MRKFIILCLFVATLAIPFTANAATEGGGGGGGYPNLGSICGIPGSNGICRSVSNPLVLLPCTCVHVQVCGVWGYYWFPTNIAKAEQVNKNVVDVITGKKVFL